MFSYVWPIALVVLSNVVYQICAKSVPNGLNPFAALTVTYLVGALMSVVLFFVLGKQPNPLKELSNLNWAPFVLGLVIVGLEVGFIYAYKAGWTVSTASLVQGSALAVILIFVGWLFFREELTWNKLVGAGICLVGLFFINYKF
ncbi:MAG: EamA family transporter [Ruminococcus sp.]|nr:EamA family transporter [Ruminococcus sp.]